MTPTRIKPRKLKLILGDPQFNGAKVVRIHSHGLCEDGATVAVTAELADRRIIMLQICPGEAISARVISD